jgi:ABC-type maltose transport system permease subunit
MLQLRSAESHTRNVQLSVLVVVNIQRQPVTAVSLSWNRFNAVPIQKLARRNCTFSNFQMLFFQLENHIYIYILIQNCNICDGLVLAQVPASHLRSSNVELPKNATPLPKTCPSLSIFSNDPQQHWAKHDGSVENSVIPHGCGCIWASLEAENMQFPSL